MIGHRHPPHGVRASPEGTNRLNPRPSSGPGTILEESMSMPSRSRASSGPLIAGTLIAVVIGIAIVALALAGITPQRAWDSFFPVGGQPVVTDRAHATRSLYDFVFYIAAAIFFIVEGLIVFTAIRYRR